MRAGSGESPLPRTCCAPYRSTCPTRLTRTAHFDPRGSPDLSEVAVSSSRLGHVPPPWQFSSEGARSLRCGATAARCRRRPARAHLRSRRSRRVSSSIRCRRPSRGSARAPCRMRRSERPTSPLSRSGSPCATRYATFQRRRTRSSRRSLRASFKSTAISTCTASSRRRRRWRRGRRLRGMTARTTQARRHTTCGGTPSRRTPERTCSRARCR